MKRFTTTVLAVAVGLAAVAALEAKGKGNSGGSNGGNSVIRSQVTRQSFNKPVQIQQSGNQQVFKQNKIHVDKKVDFHAFKQNKVHLNVVNKHQKFTIAHCPTKSWQKCDYGYCFKGHGCNHWEYKYWVPTCGCYFHYCPYSLCEYWYCVEDVCYYPVGYCPVAYRVKYASFGW